MSKEAVITPAAAAAPSVPAAKPQKNLLDRIVTHRYFPPAFITTILLVAQLSYGVLESYTRTLLAIGTAVVCEMILGRIYLGKWPILASAYISGISVGILVRSPDFWPYALCAALSITSKYVIRVRNQHIWNPSNFGICVMLITAAYTVAGLSVQWGNAVAPMIVIWMLGLVTVWRHKRLHVTLTYVALFVIFALVRSQITGHPWQAEVAPITGPMYQLYIFFMITDPRTTVRTKRGQIIVTVLIAVVEMIMRLGQFIYAPFYALALVGPPAMIYEIWQDGKREAAAQAAKQAA
jgi:Na+-transporting NADH:ubiquinone oxidoreductase subunit NqrB